MSIKPRSSFQIYCPMALVTSVVRTLAVALGLAATMFPYAHAQTLATLYNFAGDPDGSSPVAPLIRDSVGNLYGTTYAGGTNNGTVFRLSSGGSETILHTFHGTPDGSAPWAGLVRDGAGNLYGTTAYGGAFNFGTVFKISKAGKERVLYSFKSGSDGATPFAGLILDSANNLYGTTTYGGTGACIGAGGQAGCGTVFLLSPSGTETVLHNFGGKDGAFPVAGLLRDSAGNLYGTTAQGGEANCSDFSAQGCGTVFVLSHTGVETVLHSFAGAPSDGERPAGLIAGPGGNLYGTTSMGGAHSSGAVYELTSSGTEKLLYSFGAVVGDGLNPNSGLVFGDAVGSFYGTTQAGGGQGCNGNGCGTIFEVSNTGNEALSFPFSGAAGCIPSAGLIRDDSRKFYGTTSNCGTHSGPGTVFEFKP